VTRQRGCEVADSRGPIFADFSPARSQLAAAIARNARGSLPATTHLAETVAAADLASLTLEHALSAEAALSVVSESLEAAAHSRPPAGDAHLTQAAAAAAVARTRVQELAASALRELNHIISRDNAHPTEVISYDRAFRNEQLLASAATDPNLFARAVREGGERILAARARSYSACMQQRP